MNLQDAITRYKQRHGFQEFSPRLALFDMDGVLYNSMPNHAAAWVESMSGYGIKMTEEDAYMYEGMRGMETIKVFAKAQWGRIISDEESDEMYAKKSACYAKRPRAGFIPGILALHHALKAKGIEIGVVTGSGQHSLLERLRHDFADTLNPNILVSAFDVKQGKPKPDPYLQGMRKGGFEPWQTIVVENAPLGVRAGVAARCFTIAVNTGPLPDSILLDAGADIVFHTMDEVRETICK
jgi:HAD superfamily hydrolase (TIGR01509 family)